MKKIFIIIGFILIVLVLGYFIYRTFFAPAKPIQPEEPITNIEPRLPEIGERQGNLIYTEQGWLPISEVTEPVIPIEPIPYVPPTAPAMIAKGGLTEVKNITESMVQSVDLGQGGQLRYYNPETSQFYKIDADGKPQTLSNKKFYNVTNITWAAKQNKAILEYPDGSKIYYDFDKNEQVTLPKEWYEFSFSATGDKVGFLTDNKNPEQRWLAVANPDGSNAQPLEPLGENQDKVIVSLSPNNQMVAFSATGDPMGMWRQEILLVGYNGEIFRSLVVEGRDFEPQWNNQGDKIAYSAYNQDTNYQPNLYIVGAQGEAIGRGHTDLGLRTWAHKCVFSSDSTDLYCAVPKNLPEGAGLFPEMADTIADNFYKIDLKTGLKSLLAQPATSVNANNIILSSDEKYLYFTDKFTGQLKSIRLK